MKNMKNWFLISFFFVSITSMLAQGKVTGFVNDANGSLPGASVAIEGTNTATAADYDGSFTLTTTASSGNLIVSYLGYKKTKVAFTVTNGEANVGTITLQSEDNVLGEVVITSTVIDVAKDRKTPVAVSTIKAAEIREKLGSQEFPEILATTPSVYATKAGGGYGDSRINIRGFDQRNVAVMINGVPVNDMENGAVFWSNWAGLSDVTTAMQVQRGLGSSKLAIASVGGTINVITRTADAKEGGTITGSLGNNDYLKTLVSYSTGKMKNGLSASVLFSNTQGSTYANGTEFSGQNYFIGLGYEFNDKHNIQFTFTGAPQWHNQRSFANTLADYIKYGSNGEPNTRYNSDWGYLHGEEFSWARNFYHKPVASLNYDVKFSEKMKLSAVFYGSWGRGGGTGNIGRSPFAFKTATGLVPFNDFYAYNQGTYNAGTRDAVTAISGPSNLGLTNGERIASRSTGFVRRASINSHDWYGAVINLNTKLSDKLNLDFGVDARTYVGYHFRNVSDLLGAKGYNAATVFSGTNWVANDINVTQSPYVLYGEYDSKASFNPFTDVKSQEKIDYNNNGYVRWYGAFTQLEYATEKLTAFIQGAVSQQGFSREDLFQYKNDNPLQKTSFENILGGNVKGGVNYNINEKMNVFVNSGYYSKQPFLNAVYPNNKNLLNGNLVNEKILGVEAGYGFKSRSFNANLNLYYTSWKDRYQRSNDAAADNVGGYYDFAGIEEVHAGAELEMMARITDNFRINAMASYGDWKYKGNSTSNRYDAGNQPIAGGTSTTLYLDGVRVGDAAQTTASIGAAYDVFKNLTVDANYRYADRLYASINPANFSSATNKGSLELPSYGLMDAGLSFKTNRVKDSKDYFSFRVNVNNVLDKVYISESRTNIFADDKVSTAANAPTYEAAGRTYNGVADANQVFFGFGRTWNFTVRYNF